MSSAPVLYFDLASPYAYLAVARAASVLPEPPELEPILLGAIFKLRGKGSWAHTSSREMRMAEIEARARRYGLPPLAWPQSWPANALAAMRAATWAKEEGRLEEFTKAVYAAEFVRGEDPADVGLLAACAEEVGLDPDALREAIHHQAIKDKLRQATTAAWTAGVSGVPTLIADGILYYGDDQLELAAEGTP
jgi:2-hydroxychromene-2-carboxylate isomerase